MAEEDARDATAVFFAPYLVFKPRLARISLKPEQIVHVLGTGRALSPGIEDDEADAREGLPSLPQVKSRFPATVET